MRTASFNETITFTRPGTATYIDASGSLQVAAVDEPRFDYTNGRREFLLEGSATNLLLNSDELETQSVTTSAETYTLSFYGTGTVTLTGSVSGSLVGTGANDRVSLTFTATAGSLALTVSGSVNNAQLESGANPSSYIPTAGSAVTRPADNAQLTETVAALLREGAVSVLVQGQDLSGTDGRFIGGSAGTRLMGLNGAENAIIAGSSATLPVSPTSVPTTKFGFSLAYDASGKRGSYNGSAVVNDAAAMDADLTTAFVGRDSIGNFANGRYDQIVIWPFRMIDSDLQSKSDYGGGGKNPADFFQSGEKGAYFEFDDEESLYTDTARTIAASDGDAVKGVTDKSPNAAHGTQSTTNSAPLVVRRGTGTALRFSPGGTGTYSVVSSTGIPAGSALTLAFAERFEGLSIADQMLGVLDNDVGLMFDTSPNDRWALYNNAFVPVPSAGPTAGKPSVSILTMAASGEWQVFEDGALVGSGTVTNSLAVTAAFRVGAFGASLLGYYGEMTRAFCISRVLTSAEIAQLDKVFARSVGRVDAVPTTPLTRLSDSRLPATTDGMLKHSPLARAVYTTTAQTVTIDTDNDFFNAFPNWLPRYELSVDGEFYADLSVGSNGPRTFSEVVSLDLPAGEKTVEITAGPTSKSGSTIIGMYLQAIGFSGPATQIFPEDDATERVIVLGDSIDVGDGARLTLANGWVLRTRRALPSTTTLAVEGYGFGSLWDFAGDGTKRAATIALLETYSPAPTRLLVHVMTNDYGLNRQTAADYGAALAAFLDDLNAEFPDLVVIVRGALVRAVETANSLGDTLGAYRTAASNACSGRAWATYIDGSTALTTSDLRDGVHPTDDGHAKLSTWALTNEF